MLREEIISACGLSDGGTLSTVLEDLEKSGFIRRYTAFGKAKKDSMFQLIDNFTLFYFKFLKDGIQCCDTWEKRASSTSSGWPPPRENTPSPWWTARVISQASGLRWRNKEFFTIFAGNIKMLLMLSKVLFHGSDHIIEVPTPGGGKKHNDYGEGTEKVPLEAS